MALQKFGLFGPLVFVMAIAAGLQAMSLAGAALNAPFAGGTSFAALDGGDQPPR